MENGISKINLLSIKNRLEKANEKEEEKNIPKINKKKKENFNFEKVNLENLNFEKSIFKKSSRNNFNEELSTIIENFLYISNYKAASDINLLKKLDINYIINCSGDYCQNVGNDFIDYLTLNLKDNSKENIECIFYKCYDFINKCKNEKKRILIHCYQGISRSVSIVISYLMISEKMSCDKAFNFVQRKRFIANPNLGFFLQLQIFEKRLLNNEKNKIEIFSISSFQIEQPNFIVARLIYHNLINDENNNLENKKLILDKRGFYIICDKFNCFFLQGSEINQMNKQKYLNYAKYYIEKIHQNEYLILNYDKNNFSYEIIEEGNKNLILEKFLNENNINIEFSINCELDKYYIDLGKIEENGNNLNNYLIDKEELIKKGFYFYPKNEVYKILNLDDLNDDDYLIACFDNEISKKIFIWKGPNCNINNIEEESFKNYVKINFFNNCKKIIEEIIEIPFEESDDFMELL